MAAFQLGPMDMDTQFDQCFGNLSPLLANMMNSNKRARGLTQEERSNDAELRVALTQLVRVTRALGTLALRHEEAVSNLRSQDSFILFVQVAETSILNILLEAGAYWRSQKEAAGMDRPLRSFLMKKMMQELLDRLQGLNSHRESPLWKTLVKENLLLTDGSWPYQQWKASEQKSVPHPTKAAVSMQDMVNAVTEIQKLTEDLESVQRFNSLKKPVETMKVVLWRLQTGIHHQQLHIHLLHLCQNTVWSLIGAQLKQHQPQTTEPMTILQQFIYPNNRRSKGKGKGVKQQTQ